MALTISHATYHLESSLGVNIARNGYKCEHIITVTQFLTLSASCMHCLRTLSARTANEIIPINLCGSLKG